MSDLEWNREFALEQTGGDEELLTELLTLFVDSSAADFASLCEAIEAGDAEGVVRAAHSLKGAAASLGLEAIRALALDMETAARQGSVDVARTGKEEMEGLLAQVSQIL